MTTTNEDVIEAVAKAIHDKQQHPGAWDDYGCWTTNTDKVHEEYREIARAALAALPDVEVHQVTYADYDVYEIDSTWLDKAEAEKRVETLNADCIGAPWDVFSFTAQDACLTGHDFQNRVGGGALCSRCKEWVDKRV